MTPLRRWLLTPASLLAWRLPGRPRRLLSAFSRAERGSMIDVLMAAERTERRDLRRKYFLHALDEGRHAGIFAERARALGGPSRAEAALDDAGRLLDQGVAGGETLYERFGELEFLAFVWVAEQDAVDQFRVYLDRRLPDPDTMAHLRDILKDETFHVSYSKLEVERYRREGRAGEVRMALLRVRARRAWEAWLRFSRDVGAFVSGAWLLALYGLAVAPFRLFASLDSGGWQPVAPDRRDRLAAARAEG